MFSLFKKQTTSDHQDHIENGFQSLKVDMHSHVLPGIDDGAKNVEDSIKLIRHLMECGIEKIIATPHIMSDYYKNTPATILNSLRLLQAELDKQEIKISVIAAAEHYFDEKFEEMVNSKTLMTMGDQMVLFEIPFIGHPQNLISMIQRMKDQGYKPILAHPERYVYLKLKDLSIIKESGCLLQVNTLSFTGYYGKEERKTAEELAANDLIDFISSDMHHERHALAFKSAMQNSTVKNLLDKRILKNSLLFQD